MKACTKSFDIDSISLLSYIFQGCGELHEIHFYKDRNGFAPVYEYLKELSERSDKASRIKANKIADYITILGMEGTTAGMPYVKHIEGELWELRPLKDRIFFVAWYQGSYVLLHQFRKETRRTPQREIERARRELADLKERGL